MAQLASRIVLACAGTFVGIAAHANEVTVQNDSVTSFSNAVIVTGFGANEEAAAWLTSPCTGNVRAAQIFWRSQSGTTGFELGEAIRIFRAGTFPNPGALEEAILGPVLNDGDFLNEYRFLDENQSVPLIVPVQQDETFVVSLAFEVAPPQPVGPSVVRDISGCQAGRNTIFAVPPGAWVSSCALGVTGDWVIRAVVDCQVGGQTANLRATIGSDLPVYEPGQAITLTIQVFNSGPNAVTDATVIDGFPLAIQNVSWTCSAGAGASCGASAGTGNINTTVGLASGASATYVANGTIAPNANGSVFDSVTIIAPNGVVDPDTANNIATVTVMVIPDLFFEGGFEDP